METPESWFHQRATLYVEAQILFHLNQAGVWGLLKRGEPYTAAEIAARLDLDLATTETLLDYVYQVDGLLLRDDGGRYSLSPFGRQVIERYSDLKEGGGQESINMFDVRVGAYGPVWQNLGRMLREQARYGDDFQRDGRFAENGVFKLAMRFWDSLIQQIEELGVRRVVEVGLTTGLIDKLAERYPDHELYGLDRSGPLIERNAADAAARSLRNIRFLHSDFFDVERWAQGLLGQDPGLIFSLHFHELMAGGEARFGEALRKLRDMLPGWAVLAFEQPRLPHDDRANTPATLWLYAQSNILIHHLIGNGRILSRESWLQLGAEAGCRKVTAAPCNYLGYQAFRFAL